jgi:hypothetical protein
LLCLISAAHAKQFFLTILCHIAAVVKLDVDIHPSARVIASLALVKSTNAPLTADRPIASQLQLMTLGGNLNAFTSDKSPGAAFFHTLQQYTRQAFAPLVRAYAQVGVVRGDLFCASTVHWMD